MTAGVFDVADGAVVLRVRVQPGARRPGLAGCHDGALKVKVTAPPLDGRANAAVADLLARTFDLPAGRVVLVSGAASRSKRYRLEGADPGAVAATLDEVLAGTPRR